MWNLFKRKPQYSFKDLKEFVYYEYHYRIAISEGHQRMNMKNIHEIRLVSFYKEITSSPCDLLSLFEMWEELRQIIGKQIPELINETD